MNNNDILKRIRYTFDFNDTKMMELFELANFEASRAMISDWLKKEDDPAFRPLTDKKLATFLNGLIINNRGKREGPPLLAENKLDNNIILRKLKIALNLKTDDILSLFELIDKKIGPHELSAFFRHPDHHKYRPCNDQYLRQFLSGMQAKYRDK